MSPDRSVATEVLWRLTKRGLNEPPSFATHWVLPLIVSSAPLHFGGRLKRFGCPGDPLFSLQRGARQLRLCLLQDHRVGPRLNVSAGITQFSTWSVSPA